MTLHYLATVRKALSLLTEWSCGLRRSTVGLYRGPSYPPSTFIMALSTYDGGRGVRYMEKNESPKTGGKTCVGGPTNMMQDGLA